MSVRAAALQNLGPPDYERRSGEYQVAVAGAHAKVTQLWNPTEENSLYTLHYELATNATPELTADEEEMAYPIWSARLAAGGMRRIFEEVGIVADYKTEPGDTRYGAPSYRHTITFQVPESVVLCGNINKLTCLPNHSNRTHLQATPFPDGRFDGVKLVESLHNGKLLVAADEKTVRPYSKPGAPMLTSEYLHDMWLHIPAWLSLPRPIIQAISDKAGELYTEYQKYQHDHPYHPRRQAAREAISTFTGTIDSTVTTRQLARVACGEKGFYKGKPLRFGNDVVKLLGYGRALHFEEMAREHIANPLREDILAR